MWKQKAVPFAQKYPRICMKRLKNYTSVTVVILLERDKASTHTVQECVITTTLARVRTHTHTHTHIYILKQHTWRTDRFWCNTQSTLHNQALNSVSH